MTEQISAGRQWVDFLLDRSEPIRELRLDLPDKVGVTLWFRDIGIFDRAELSPRWVGREGVELELHSDGLDMVARNADPWMTVTTPGLGSKPFQTVGLVLHGTGPTAPQLYWDGACGHFDEACSVLLVPADAGDLTHTADLSRVPTWRGAIRQLRLDPGNAAGDYTLDRLTLSGEDTNAKRAR